MNIGAVNAGSGEMKVRTAAGQQVNSPQPFQRPEESGKRADVGVICILEEEMAAVVGLLRRSASYRTRALRAGAKAHEAVIVTDGGRLKVVAMQALIRGPRSAAEAYHRLQDSHRPPVVLLVGIAGSIRPGTVDIGDVVFSDQVVYYDARRESADGPYRRGQAYLTESFLGHRMNEFFRETRGVVQHDGTSFRLHRGPIGSGDAVLTDEHSEIVRWLRTMHEKTLAVETEAAGVVQAYHEAVHEDPGRGFLTIRGISDYADRAKGHQYHELASERAAMALEGFLPFLCVADQDEG